MVWGWAFISMPMFLSFWFCITPYPVKHLWIRISTLSYFSRDNLLVQSWNRVQSVCVCVHRYMHVCVVVGDWQAHEYFFAQTQSLATFSHWFSPKVLFKVLSMLYSFSTGHTTSARMSPCSIMFLQLLQPWRSANVNAVSLCLLLSLLRILIWVTASSISFLCVRMC